MVAPLDEEAAIPPLSKAALSAARSRTPANGKAEPAIKLGRRVEVAHCMGKMVKPAGHEMLLSLHRRERRRLQEHVLD
jgi:hypothetical protein